MKHLLMLLASERFRDIEYLVPRAFFEQHGFKVSLVSSSANVVGRFGYKVTVDYVLGRVDASAFDGLYFVGGAGSLEYLENAEAEQLTKAFLNAGKPVAAICAAPKNLLKWGLLKNKKATGHNGDGSFEKMALEYGAIPLPTQTVVQEGLLLTANGPEASEESALAFMKMVE